MKRMCHYTGEDVAIFGRRKEDCDATRFSCRRRPLLLACPLEEAAGWRMRMDGRPEGFYDTIRIEGQHAMMQSRIGRVIPFLDCSPRKPDVPEPGVVRPCSHHQYEVRRLRHGALVVRERIHMLKHL